MREEDKSNILPTCLKILDRVHNQRNKRESNNYNQKNIFRNLYITPSQPTREQDNEAVSSLAQILERIRQDYYSTIVYYSTKLFIT